jgi:hypothetical protein
MTSYRTTSATDVADSACRRANAILSSVKCFLPIDNPRFPVFTRLKTTCPLWWVQETDRTSKVRCRGLLSDRPTTRQPGDALPQLLERRRTSRRRS